MARDSAESADHEGVAGHRLVQRVKDLVAEGNARAVRVTTDDGKVFLEVPLTPAAVTGGIFALAVPWLAVLTTLAAVVAHVKVQIIERSANENVPPPPAAQGKPATRA